MKPDKERKKNKGYDFIFSIGASCHCASALRDNYLRQQSCPFDWLVYASIEERADLIVNDFHNFFEKDDFQKVGESNEYNPCDLYRNIKTGIAHVHDFKHGIDFDISFKEAKAKYDRRIKRFYEQMSKSKRVLAVYLVKPHLSESVPDETLIRIQQKLQQKFPKQQMDILYLESKPELYKTEPHQEYIVNDNIIKIYANFEPIVHYFNTPDTSIPDYEVVQKIFNEFYLTKNKYLEIRKLKKGFGIYLLQRIFTIFRLKLYLFGLRLDFCLGKIRD